jgi:hypothetical protein
VPPRSDCSRELGGSACAARREGTEGSADETIGQSKDTLTTGGPPASPAWGWNKGRPNGQTDGAPDVGAIAQAAKAARSTALRSSALEGG